MLKYSPLEIYVLVCLCTVILTCVVGWLVLYIRDRISAQRIVEAERFRYIRPPKRERNFYRTQYEARNLLESADSTIAFNNMMQEAGK